MSLVSPLTSFLFAAPPAGLAAWFIGKHKQESMNWALALPVGIAGTLTLAASLFTVRLRSLRAQLISEDGKRQMPGECLNIPYGDIDKISRRPRLHMLEMRQLHGDIYVHWKMWLPIVTVASVDAVKQICSASFDRIPEGDIFPPLFRRFLKGSIFYAGGERHKLMRRIMTPLFVRRENLAAAADIGGQVATKVALDMKHRASKAGGQLLLNGNELQDLGFAMVKQCLFEGMSNEDGRALLDYIDSFMQLMKNPLCWLPFFHWLPLPSVRDFIKHERVAHAVLDSVFRRVRNIASDDQAISKMGKSSLLQQLVLSADADGGITDFELRQNALTLLTAGSQDAGNTILHVCLALAKYPAEQEKAAAEVKRELGVNAPTAEVLPRLKWLDCCIKEGQRMFPHMNMLWTKRRHRQATVCGYCIPPLVPIAVDMVSLHYDKDLWTRPKDFDPSRFDLSKDGSAAHPDMAYIPFGAGSRICVAYKMGPVLLKAALASLLQHVKLEFVDSGDDEDGLRGYMDVGIEHLDGLFQVTPR